MRAQDPSRSLVDTRTEDATTRVAQAWARGRRRARYDFDEADMRPYLELGRVITDGSPDDIRRKTRTDDIEGAFLALVEAGGDVEAGAGGAA